MSAGSPYREPADPLGELRQEYRGRWTGQLRFGTVSVVIVLVIIVWFSVSVLAGFGSWAAIVADVRKGSDSQVLVVPMFLAFGAFLAWLMMRITSSVRHERVRFYGNGLELVDRKGGIRRCRFAEIAGVELADDSALGGRGRVVVAKVRLRSEEVWVVGAWFDVGEIQARLSVAIRRRSSEAG
jgi:hypothetical protein